MMYENITDPKGCIDAINGSFGWTHAEQAAHLYEEHTNLDFYSELAVEEIIDYLEEEFEGNSDAGYIVAAGKEILKRIKKWKGE
jgi:hypothetical protein